MKLRNLNGAIRKAEGRSVKIRIATPMGPITAGLTKQELLQGFADLALDPMTETGMTVEGGFLRFEDGADVFGDGLRGQTLPGDEDTFDQEEIDLLVQSDASIDVNDLGNTAAAQAQQDALAADHDDLLSDAEAAGCPEIEDLLAD